MGGWRTKCEPRANSCSLQASGLERVMSGHGHGGHDAAAAGARHVMPNDSEFAITHVCARARARADLTHVAVQTRTPTDTATAGWPALATTRMSRPVVGTGMAMGTPRQSRQLSRRCADTSNSCPGDPAPHVSLLVAESVCAAVAG